MNQPYNPHSRYTGEQETNIQYESWEKAHFLVQEIYQFTLSLHRSHTFGNIVEQLEAESIRLTTNLTEGYYQIELQEKEIFYNRALLSLGKIENFLILIFNIYQAEPSIQLSLRSNVNHLREEIQQIINSLTGKQNAIPQNPAQGSSRYMSHYPLSRKWTPNMKAMPDKIHQIKPAGDPVSHHSIAHSRPTYPPQNTAHHKNNSLQSTNSPPDTPPQTPSDQDPNNSFNNTIENTMSPKKAVKKDQGTIIKVSGPLVVAEGMEHAKMYEVVRVSDHRLIGEVIRLENGKASIQVYEETSGIGPGEPVYLTGQTLSVELAPGLLSTIYDGIQRPLDLIEEQSKSPFISRGIDVPSISREKKWDFKATMKKGDKVECGDILGEVQETTLIMHRIMVPSSINKGTIEQIKSGNFTIEDVIAVIKDENGKSHDVAMLQRWPIRNARKVKNKKVPSIPLVSGIRILDTLFPMLKGGAGCIPGPFGAGKTVTQQALAKYCDAEVIVYIGCGERGNEMTDVLMEFPHLTDPKTGEPLMKRTIMIANTSNMPVAAREASVYTGISIAEYYRDMGYNVALMADSTSRWAEAMREISGRLEEMPGEEGYPAYLGSRTAQFYERAGYVTCLGSDEREGSLSVIGAVSPPGGDFSEPVTQNTLRVTKVFWALDASLAYKRHFPAIHWLTSYSLYVENATAYYKKNVSEDYLDVRREAMSLLQQESALEEIVRLVGMDSLSPKDQLILETTKAIREDFLFQNAFDDRDAFTSLIKQYRILRSILTFYHTAQKIVDQEDFEMQKLRELPVRTKMVNAHFIEEGKWEEFDKIEQEIQSEIAKLMS